MRPLVAMMPACALAISLAMGVAHQARPQSDSTALNKPGVSEREPKNNSGEFPFAVTVLPPPETATTIPAGAPTAYR